MDSPLTTLAIDVGPSTTAAAVDRGGHRMAVVFGDKVTMPTPTVGDSPGVDLLAAVVATSTADAEQVIGILAEHLGAVAAHAGPADAIMLVTPPSWGPRHHDRIAESAQRAGLSAVQVISEAAAVATRTFPAAPQQATVLVCRLGQHLSHVTVVQRHHGDWLRIATQALPAATGQQLDRALAHRLSPHPDDTVTEQVTRAHRRLAAGEPAAIMLPGQPMPIAVTPGDFNAAVEPLRHMVLDAITDVLDAAGVDPKRLHGTVLHGDCATTLMPSAAADLLGSEPVTASDGRLAAPFGALDITRSPATSPAKIRAIGWGRRGSHLIAPLTAAIAGILLQWQIIDVVQQALPPEIYRRVSDYEKLRVFFDTAAFAASGWALTLACIAVGRNLAAAYGGGSRAEARQAGRIFAFSAVMGLAFAAMQGLVTQAVLGGPADLAPPYLLSALAAAFVPAMIAIVIGLASPWLTGRSQWTEHVHHPVAAVVLAAVGILAVTARLNDLPLGGVPPLVGSILGFCGSGLLGVAIALTLLADKYARAILGVVLGIGCMIIVGVGNLHSVILIYLISVALWWVRRAVRILADTLPNGWWRRFGLADSTENPQPPA